MEEDKKQSEYVSIEDLSRILDLVKFANAVSENVLFRYTSMVDFIKSKGMLKEWENYLLDQFPEGQNPARN
jgi:hypothetical protein